MPPARDFQSAVVIGLIRKMRMLPLLPECQSRAPANGEVRFPRQWSCSNFTFNGRPWQQLGCAGIDSFCNIPVMKSHRYNFPDEFNGPSVPSASRANPERFYQATPQRAPSLRFSAQAVSGGREGGLWVTAPINQPSKTFGFPPPPILDAAKPQGGGQRGRGAPVPLLTFPGQKAMAGSGGGASPAQRLPDLHSCTYFPSEALSKNLTGKGW